MKTPRIHPDTLRVEMVEIPDPRPIGRVGKRPVYKLRELPSFIATELPAGAVRISVADRVYLLYTETVQYTRIAALLIQIIFVIVALINALNRLPPNKEQRNGS